MPSPIRALNLVFFDGLRPDKSRVTAVKRDKNDKIIVIAKCAEGHSIHGLSWATAQGRGNLDCCVCKRPVEPCRGCGKPFRKRAKNYFYCTTKCGQKDRNKREVANQKARRENKIVTIPSCDSALPRYIQEAQAKLNDLQRRYVEWCIQRHRTACLRHGSPIELQRTRIEAIELSHLLTEAEIKAELAPQPHRRTELRRSYGEHYSAGVEAKL